MSEHVEAAKGGLRDAEDYQNDWHSLRCEVKSTVYDEIRWARDMMQVSAQVAQAEATLALVEQQRIANLIALATVPADGVLAAQPAFDARAALVEYREHDNPEMGGWLELRPEIARALGLGVGDE